MKVNPPTLVSLDPSSTAIGWAIFDGSEVREAGVKRIKNVGLMEKIRIAEGFIDGLSVGCNGPTHAVVEIPGKRTGIRSGDRMTKYGMFVGVAILACIRAIGEPTLVTPEEWTGRKKMDYRRDLVVQEFRYLDFSDDRGDDMKDAILIGQWWLAQQRIKEASNV